MMKIKSERKKLGRYGSKIGGFGTTSKLICVNVWLVKFFSKKKKTQLFSLSHFAEKFPANYLSLFMAESPKYIDPYECREAVAISPKLSLSFVLLNPGLQRIPPVFKPSDELSGSHVRRRCVSSSNHEFAGPSGFSDEKKSHHVPLPSLSNDQVNGSVSGSGSVSSVSSSGSGEDQVII